MKVDKADGDPAAMLATAQQLTPPQLPGSLARVGEPIKPPGLVEGFAMSIVDKLAAVAAADYLGKVTNDIVTHASDIHRVSLTYSWADLTSAAGIVGATSKVANQGIGLIKTVTGAGASSGDADSGSTGTD